MRYFIFAFFAVIFGGCFAKQTPQNSQTFLVNILSPMVKISDVGFIHNYKRELNLQIYNSAVNILNIKVGEKICINNACYKKSEFNENFFKNSHYDDILSDILLSKPIYNGENLVKTECGFNQNIKNNLIQYEVCGNNMKFINGRVKVMLKELK